MRILGRNKFYVKDTLTIEKIAKLDTLFLIKQELLRTEKNQYQI
jgi:Cu+-exporting ATPase